MYIILSAFGLFFIYSPSIVGVDSTHFMLNGDVINFLGKVVLIAVSVLITGKIINAAISKRKSVKNDN